MFCNRNAETTELSLKNIREHSINSTIYSLISIFNDIRFIDLAQKSTLLNKTEVKCHTDLKDYEILLIISN